MSEEMRRAFVIDDEQPEEKTALKNDELEKIKRATLGNENLENIAKFELDVNPEDLKSTEEPQLSSSVVVTEEENEPSETHFWSSPILWILLFITGWGGLQVWTLIAEAYASSPLLGWCWGVGLSVLLVIALFMLYRELGTVLLLKEADENRAKAVQISKEGNFNDALKLCEVMAKSANVKKTRGFANFVSKLQNHYTPENVFMLYEDELLKDADRRAREVIVKRSAENGVVVALSPVAWLDMLITFARSLRMIREVSEIYGFKPGVWGRMQLYRRVAKNLVFIGVTDLATDAVVDALGAGVTTRISAAMGQGVAASIWSSRLGYMAVKAVRPLPVTPRVLTLGRLRKDLLSTGALSKLIKESAKTNSDSSTKNT